MGVDLEIYSGLCIELPNPELEVYDWYNEFEEKYPEYDRYNYDLENTGRVMLIVDGMCGEYAKLMYVTSFIDEDSYGDDDDEHSEVDLDNLDSAREDLKKAYKLLSELYAGRGADLPENPKIKFITFKHYC